MDMSGAFYGGGLAKVGQPFDFITFFQRKTVMLRAVCWLFAIIVFACISSKGWRLGLDGKDHCIINDDTNCCNYAVGIGVIAFLASMGFLAGEYLFEQMSSVKTRKHYVMGDMAFSALWSFLFFVGFCYLTNQWSNADDKDVPEGIGTSNVQAAIVFSFFSIFTWAGCAYFAYLRFKAGVDPTFQTAAYESDPNNQQAYSSYPDANDNDQYQEPPFSGGGQLRGGPDYQAPTY